MIQTFENRDRAVFVQGAHRRMESFVSVVPEAMRSIRHEGGGGKRRVACVVAVAVALLTTSAAASGGYYVLARGDIASVPAIKVQCGHNKLNGRLALVCNRTPYKTGGVIVAIYGSKVTIVKRGRVIFQTNG